MEKFSEKKSVWLTYAWEDNNEQDVDFIAQELVRADLDVKLDRWNLNAGRRLWEQIASFIQDPDKSDGWILYATQASLGSEACKEEFAYALDRALNERGKDFPIIGLFPAPVDKNLIPAGIKTRLYVSTTDPDWKERIVSTLQGRSPSIITGQIKPYVIKIYEKDLKRGHKKIIELRPRGGTWVPFAAGIPSEEKEKVSPSLSFGPSNRVPGGCMLVHCGEGFSSDKKIWIMCAGNEATPTQSYYIFCDELPSCLIFGVDGRAPQYKITFDN